MNSHFPIGPSDPRSISPLDPVHALQIQTLSTALATNLSGLEHVEAHSTSRALQGDSTTTTTAARAQGADGDNTGVGIGGGETMTYLQVWIVWTGMDWYGREIDVPEWDGE